MSGSRKLRLFAIVAILFGLLTVFSGAYALFGGEAARASVGNAVPFVLWFNFIAGFLYVAAGIGLWFQARWSVLLAALIAAMTVLVFIIFGIHVFTGGAYEMRTVGAMTLRSIVWIGIAVIGWRTMSTRTDN